MAFLLGKTQRTVSRMWATNGSKSFSLTFLLGKRTNIHVASIHVKIIKRKEEREIK